MSNVSNLMEGADVMSMVLTDADNSLRAQVMRLASQRYGQGVSLRWRSTGSEGDGQYWIVDRNNSLRARGATLEYLRDELAPAKAPISTLTEEDAVGAEKMVRVEEAAKKLGCHSSVIFRLIKAGVIKASGSRPQLVNVMEVAKALPRLSRRKHCSPLPGTVTQLESVGEKDSRRIARERGLVTREKAARMIGVSDSGITGLVGKRGLPAYSLLWRGAGRLFFDPEQIQAWLATHTVKRYGRRASVARGKVEPAQKPRRSLAGAPLGIVSVPVSKALSRRIEVLTELGVDVEKVLQGVVVATLENLKVSVR